MYVVQMGRTIDTKCTEHMRHICLGQPKKLSVEQHKFGTGHNMELGITSILDIALGYMDHLIEATEIWLHHRNSDRDRGFNVSQSWYSVTKMIKGHCNKPIWRQGQDKRITPPTTTPLAPVQFQSWYIGLVYRRDDLNLMSHQIMMRGQRWHLKHW
jgi:hypothetical protein